jgi:hypothetical protein
MCDTSVCGVFTSSASRRRVLMRTSNLARVSTETVAPEPSGLPTPALNHAVIFTPLRSPRTVVVSRHVRVRDFRPPSRGHAPRKYRPSSAAVDLNVNSMDAPDDDHEGDDNQGDREGSSSGDDSDVDEHAKRRDPYRRPVFQRVDGYKQPTASTHEGNRWRDLVPEIKDVMITMAASSQRRCGCCFEELPPDVVRFRCPCQLQDFCGMCDDRLHPQSSVHIWQRWDAATLSWVARTTVPRLTWSRHVDGVGGSDLNTAIGCTCEGRSHQSARVDLLTFDGMFTCICSHRCGPPFHIVCRLFRYC